MRTTSNKHSPKQVHASDTKEQENQQTRQKASCIKRRKGRLHNWWRTRALGFHQATTEESRKQQDWFCIKLYIILYQITCIFAV